MLVPLYRDLSTVTGHALKVLTRLAAMAGPSRRGEVFIEEIARPLRMSETRAIEALRELEGVGVWHSYRLGLVTFTIPYAERVLRVEDWAARALMILSPSAAKLYFAIASHCHSKDQMAYPGYERLGRILGRCRRTVERGVRALVESGLFAASRIAWSRVRRFQWFKSKPRRRRSIKVFVRNISNGARTLSQTAAQQCRGVIKGLLMNGLSSGGRAMALVPIDALPEELRCMAQVAPERVQKADLRRVPTLCAIGMTSLQARWVCGRWSGASIDLALRRLNERWGTVRHRVAYVVGILGRLALMGQPA